MQEFQNIFTLEIRNIFQEAGVYIIFWIRNGKPVPIPRVLATCKRGILYIGSSKNLRRRLNELKTSIEMARNKRKEEKYRHTFGPSLAYTGLLGIISDGELYIWFKFLKDYKNQEKLALLDYARRYGEPHH